MGGKETQPAFGHNVFVAIEYYGIADIVIGEDLHCNGDGAYVVEVSEYHTVGIAIQQSSVILGYHFAQA